MPRYVGDASISITKQETNQLHRFYLFNCDHTYNLETVEHLLTATKPKLGLKMSVDKYYFPLSQMSELCTATIPQLQMNAAFLVVNANESRLSINEDVNAGHSYAMIYRALLKATGERVIIVIGEDDNYKNKNEEDQAVISRWAWRIISSQFPEEFLDGRKGFVFSWAKKHRPIHEEALLHYFDAEKSGQKFVCESKKKLQAPKSSTQSDLEPGDGRIQETESSKEQRAKPSVPESESHYRGGVSQQSSEKGSDSGLKEERELGKTVIPGSGLGARPKVHQCPATRDDTSQQQLKDLVIFGCNTADESICSVRQVIEDLRPKLNLSTDPPVVRGSPVELKSYLIKNSVRFCLLVIDSETIKEINKSLPEHRVEYEQLLKTAAQEVVERVIVIMCCPSSLQSNDDIYLVTQAIRSSLMEKGMIVRLEEGKVTMDSEAVLQIMLSISAGKPNTSEPTDTEIPLPDTHQSRDRQSQADHVTSDCTQIPAQEEMLKTHLRHGRISYDKSDLDVLYPGWKVPDYIKGHLLQKHSQTSDAELVILSDEKGELRCHVKPFRQCRIL